MPIKLIKTEQGKNKDTTTVFIKGKVMYAKVQKPAKKYGSDDELEYSLDIELTEPELKKLKELGVNKKKQLRTHEDGKTYLSVKRPATKDDSGNIRKLQVVDSTGSTFTELVGNGSTVIVQVNLFPYTNTFGKGISTRLGAVQVLELVPYEGRPSIDTDGFELSDDTPFTSKDEAHLI